MRRLPHLDIIQQKLAHEIYIDKMRHNLPPDKFAENLTDIYGLVFQITRRQSQDVLNALPGLSKGIDDFTDDEQFGILEPLDGPLTTLSQRRKWRWVNPEWDHSDLELWDRLSHPPIEDGIYSWKTPVPAPSLQNLLYDSKRVLDGIPNPKRWLDYGNETGLILGSVQSGKTASMLGVSSLALDQKIGYKILIVLGGHTENLRLQTLERFQVFGKILKSDVHFASTHDSDLRDLQKDTRRNELRDNVEVCKRHLDHGPGRPVIFVIKKNKHALRGLIAIMEKLHIEGKKYPTLILDDESDHSSLNTKRNQDLGSTIHRLICGLRDSIPQNSYLGYTATPQGVLLSDPESPLFPRDFLWMLEPHGKYVGPNDFFNGMSSMLISTINPSEYPNPGDDEVESILEQEDSPRLQEWQLSVIKNWIEGGPPPSVYSAIVDFVLTGAVRWWRKDFDEESNFPDHAMMFHTDRRKEAQKLLGRVIELAWDDCSDAIIDLMSRDFNFNRENKFDQIIENRWERIESNIESIRYDPKDRPRLDSLRGYMELIIALVSKKNSDFIRDGIRIVNSDEGSELPYHLDVDKGRPPKALILIGGDLLSRGLTIEGLCVSYYLRLARKPSLDTELQRCRWFGAKKEYEDLLTLHIQPSHQRMFKDLADHNEDLMRQVKETILKGYTPMESIFLLSTRDSYQVTGYSKRGKLISKLEDSYSGNGIQFKQPSILKSSDNLRLLDDYLISLAHPNVMIAGNRGKLWENIAPNPMFNFLEQIECDVDAPSQIRPKELARYLRKWKNDPEREFPSINLVLRFGESKSEISRKRREMDGADGKWKIRTSFTNLAAGASGNFSGDWFIDALKSEKAAKDMDKQKYENWFKEIPGSTQEKWQRTRSRKRKKGAPILFVFYKLDPNYVHQKRKDGKPGIWLLNPISESELIAESPLVGFIASLPDGGPIGGGIANSMLIDPSIIKMIGGREVGR